MYDANLTSVTSASQSDAPAQVQRHLCLSKWSSLINQPTVVGITDGLISAVGMIIIVSVNRRADFKTNLSLIDTSSRRATIFPTTTRRTQVVAIAARTIGTSHADHHSNSMCGRRKILE
jgi:hypothetical protein